MEPSSSAASSSSAVSIARLLLLFASGALAAPAARHASRALRRLRRRAADASDPAASASGVSSPDDEDDCGPSSSSPGGALDRTTFFDEERFERWVSMRLGGHRRTTFWYSTGELCSYPGGEPLATVEGFDVLYCLRDEARKGVVHQLSRKIFVFRDVATGEVLRRWRGAPVPVIRYPYQKITYSLTPEGRLFTEVTQGSGPGVTRMTGTSIGARRLGRVGNGFVFTCPVFLNLEAAGADNRGGGAYQCYENYDFFIPDHRARDGGPPPRPHCSWVRYGATPPFSDAAVMHVVSWRVDSFQELPARMRAYTLRHAPAWASPPRSLEEVASMQREDTLSGHGAPAAAKDGARRSPSPSSTSPPA